MHLENKFSTCGSNFNFKLVSMSDAEFHCSKGVLIQNFNIVDLVKSSGKI
jgi:hypothetical protein